MVGNTWGNKSKGKPRPYMLGTKYALGHKGYSPHKYARGFQVHLNAFKNMWARNLDYGIEVAKEFDQTAEGFQAFVNFIGPVPEGMTSPSVGRDDHSQGYVRDNFRWESWNDNRKEALHRRWKKAEKDARSTDLLAWLLCLSIASRSN